MTGILYVFPAADKMDKKESARYLGLAAESYLEEKGAKESHFFGTETRETLFETARTACGKPYFINLPEVRFSISHSGAYWVCAMAEAEIGVDLQEHVRLKGESVEEASLRFQKMARRFFHPRESLFVEEGLTFGEMEEEGLLERYERFFSIWAAREAYVKYTGQGIDQEFSRLCVVPGEKEAWSSLMQRKQAVSWQAEGAWFTQLPFREDYSLCLCAGQPMEYEIRDLFCGRMEEER